MATDRGRPRDRRPGDETVVPLRKRSGIADARRYTPRGRTVREIPDTDRPRLRVVDGGGRPTAPSRAATPAGAGRSRPDTAAPAPARTGGRPAKPSPSQGVPATPTTRTPRARTTTPPRSTPGRPARTRTPVPPARRPRTVRVRTPRPVRIGDPRIRLRLGTALVLLLFAVIGGRLVELQLVDAGSYAQDGLENRLRDLKILAPRGAILDRYGNVLAHSVEAREIYADPTMIEDATTAAAKLAPVIGVPPSRLWSLMQPSKLPDGRANMFVPLARGVDIGVGDAVTRLNIKGIGVMRDEIREVPGNDLAANIIGFAGTDGGGLAGLEAAYDGLLRGVDGRRLFEVGSTGQEIPSGYHSDQPDRPGTSLRLTIDSDLQYETQRLLSTHLSRTRAAFSCAVVLDVHTGDVLAMASTPAYDAANPPGNPPGDACTQQAVDPGSIHKAVTIGAALQAGVVKPDSLIDLTPSITKGDTTIWDTHPHTGPQTLPGVLAFSSNVGTIHIADMLGAQRLYAFQRRFGLGRPTGVGLPNEAAGLIQPPDRWSGSAYGSIPIGMGVSVTPLQMAAVYATIANGGTYVQPHLVQATVDPDGTVHPAAAAATRRVLDTRNADALRTMLQAVVTVPGATGKAGRVPGYLVAGKTGTGAYVVNGRYARGDVASFIGMAPADAPRYVVAVFAYTPQGGEGGPTTGTTFSDVMSFALSHYRVPPTGAAPPQFRVYQ